MNDWQHFDTATLTHGYAELYAKLTAFGSEAAISFERLHQHQRSPTVFSALLAERSVNGRAASTSGKYAIALHVALPCVLHFCFNNLLRSEYFLPHIGDPGREEPYRDFSTGVPIVLPDTESLPFLIEHISNAARPRDDERATAAVGLLQLATSFCFFHELSHVQLGHVDSVERLLGEPEHLELFSWRPPRWRRRKLGRVWEYEADKIAAMMVASDILSPQNRDSFAEAFAIDSNKEPERLLGIAMTAIYTVFFLLDQRKQRWRWQRSYHPPPLTRFASVVATICSDVAEQAGLDSEKIGGLAFDDLLSTHMAWEQFGLARPHELGKIDTWTPLMQQLDRLELDRLQLMHLYRSNAFAYPFQE